VIKPTNLGRFLLPIWFILFGVLNASFLKISFAHSGDVLAILALAVGVLLFMER